MAVLELSAECLVEHPPYSFMGDWVMNRDIWIGKVRI